MHVCVCDCVKIWKQIRIHFHVWEKQEAEKKVKDDEIVGFQVSHE